MKTLLSVLIQFGSRVMWDMARGRGALYDCCSIVIIFLNNRGKKERHSLVVYKVKQVE